MFLAADVMVKAVMVGLAFASLVTWTVFIAKMIELSFVRRKLRAALARIRDARSLAEAQFSLGAKDSVLSALLAAAMGEARLSAGISSDAGIKERAASSFAEIVRAEGRRVRAGMGLLATHRCDVAVRRAVRHRLGHHEQLHRHLEIADDQSRRGGAGHRRSAARDRDRPRRRHSGGHHLQSFRARDERLLGLSAALGCRGRLLSRDLDRSHVGRRCAFAQRRSRPWRFARRYRFDDDSDFAETHEINVTPFIDVMLVLLIIFMVAAPLSTVDLPVDLPTSTATPQKKPDKPTYVTIKPDLAVAIGENPVKRVDLVQLARRDADSDKDRRIFLRAERAVPYGDLMDVLELLRAGGYSKVALVALEGVPERRGAAGSPTKP